ncbi:SHOCT domain-containing protein [Oribacterium sp. P6A1]|uniref:SHOCT domain-containing protein n=1 Tax=Oribacterium sp. P6A1 TaxID=1410612 RepID=UPI00068E27C8|nr:SHOCT domain-containing protein [Oribacterium sp. P6A1]
MVHTFDEIIGLLGQTMGYTPDFNEKLGKTLRGHIELAVNYLDSDEETLAVANCQPLQRRNAPDIIGCVVIFTTKRILLCGGTSTLTNSLSCTSILIDNVSSINPSKGFLLGSVQIETIGNDDIRMLNLKKEEVDRITKKFTDALKIAKEKIKENSVTTIIHKEASAADEILKFKGLLDAGIITQEEFNAKKNQLLGL